MDSGAGEGKARWATSARRGAVGMRQGPKLSGRAAPGSSIHGNNVGSVVPHLRGAFFGRVFGEKKTVLWYHTSVAGSIHPKNFGPLVPHFRSGAIFFRKNRSCGTTLPRRGVFIQKKLVLWYHTSAARVFVQKKSVLWYHTVLGVFLLHSGAAWAAKNQYWGTTLSWDYSIQVPFGRPCHPGSGCQTANVFKVTK